MQIAITLVACEGADYSARDLGFLLHKHPAHLHARPTAAGTAYVFYSEQSERRTTALLYLEVDPVALVRGRSPQAEGLLAQYVNDRPYVANSFLSVAISRVFGQTLSGKSKGRQDLADRSLPFEIEVTPIAGSGGQALATELFRPLGYEVGWTELGEGGLGRLNLVGVKRLAEVLTHVYVLLPVLDNAKHYWIGEDEVEKLLEKGEGWLAGHPARELIVKRALRYRPNLARAALERLVGQVAPPDEEAGAEAAEDTLEKPIQLHELRLDTVAEVLKQKQVQSVLDLGCGEGRLMRRLVADRGIQRIVGVDPSVATLARASRRLRLDDPSEAVRRRVSLQMGSLTYGDRRWHGFDAATLVEVIEHVEPARLPTLEHSLFADARPRLVVVTTPNREYNALFEGMPEGAMRHRDHRFEWTRSEFEGWGRRAAAQHGYAVEFAPVGPLSEAHGAPSQMAVFERAGKPRGDAA